MDPDDRPQRPLDAVERQAHAWVVRLTSGEATALAISAIVERPVRNL